VALVLRVMLGSLLLLELFATDPRYLLAGGSCL
jgi:hypothetical protein